MPKPRRPIRRIRSKALISYRRFKSKIVTKFRNLISYQLMCVAKKGQKSYQEQNIIMTERQKRYHGKRFQRFSILRPKNYFVTFRCDENILSIVNLSNKVFEKTCWVQFHGQIEFDNWILQPFLSFLPTKNNLLFISKLMSYIAYF